MDFDPKVYDNSNIDTLIPAKRLIKLINQFKANQRQYSVILDIGCGSGNMTKMMSEEIECQKIIGCDIDPKMIEFANKVNNNSNIDYFIQDIQQEWSDFSPEMRALKGKVSVITSNFALTWVKDITTAAQNISNLLSDDGVCVLNIVYDGDIYERLTPYERFCAQKLLNYPKEEEMIGKWIQGFKRSGLTQLDVQYWEPKVIFKERIYFEEYLNIPINWYKSYSNLKNGENLEMSKILKQLLIEDRCKRLETKSSDGEDLIEVKNYIWQIVAKKSSCTYI